MPYAVFQFLSLFLGDWYQEAHLAFAIYVVNPYKSPLVTSTAAPLARAQRQG